VEGKDLRLIIPINSIRSLRDVRKTIRIGEYRMNFDHLDMVYYGRRRQRPRYLINLKRALDQSFSISSVTDLQLEGRLER
jgi:Leu/Phe-tRNA-protein transferase